MNIILALRTAVFVVNILVTSITHSLLLLLLYPLKFILPQLYNKTESWLYSTCGQSMVPFFGIYPKLRIYLDNASESFEAVKRKRAVVMVNHQDTGDVPVMMMLLASFNLARTVTWISDVMFKWTPFGIPSQWHNDFFSKEGKETRPLMEKNIREHFSTTYFKKGHRWLIFFPEGGFLKNRGESARNYARKNGLPVLNNCCLPRTTAFVNVIRAFRGDVRPVPEKVEDILDVTLGFKGGLLCLQDVLLGKLADKEVFISIKMYKISELPQGEEELTTWLYDRYVEKEALLENFKAKGKFEDDKEFYPLKINKTQLTFAFCFWYLAAFFVGGLYYKAITCLYTLASG